MITVHDNTAIVEQIISTARQLPPQDRVHVLQQVAATFAALEPTANGEKGMSFFDQKLDLQTLATEQGVSPVHRFDDLFGDFWPEDETVDEFIAAVREWRREATTEPA